MIEFAPDVVKTGRSQIRNMEKNSISSILDANRADWFPTWETPPTDVMLESANFVGKFIVLSEYADSTRTQQFCKLCP